MFTARSARPSTISRAASRSHRRPDSSPRASPRRSGCRPCRARARSRRPFPAPLARPPGTTECGPAPARRRCRLRLEEVHPLQHPELADQPHGQVETDRVQRVVPVEPVGEELPCPHHRSSRAHAGKLSDPAAARSCRRSRRRPPVGSRPCSGGERGGARWPCGSPTSACCAVGCGSNGRWPRWAAKRSSANRRTTSGARCRCPRSWSTAWPHTWPGGRPTRWRFPHTLRAASLLGLTLGSLGEHQQARQIQNDTVTRSHRSRSDDHPDTLTSASRLAADLRALGENHLARALDEDTWPGAAECWVTTIPTPSPPPTTLQPTCTR